MARTVAQSVVMDDHTKLSQDDFSGLYDRGMDDIAPDAYFLDCLNNKFATGDVLTRDGIQLNYTKSNIVRYALYKRLDETPRFIVLDSSGNLYDSLYAPAIYTDATFLDFSIFNYDNKAYITPHNRSTGIASKKLLVYEGNGTARLAAGLAPTGFVLGAANSGVSGSVEAGYHRFAVVYQTSTGFITKPGPTLFPALLATGGFKVAMSNLPIGPTGTVARMILATKSVPTSIFSPNQLAYEFFFVPNGTIGDNVTTSLTIDFYDSDLADSADFLFDNLETIPAGVAITAYQTRLVISAPSGQAHIAYVSNPYDPETINAISGFITVDPTDASSGIRNAGEFRGNLLFFKSNRIYNTADNGAEPNTWSVTSVDKSAGTECFGINTVLDARGTNNDRLFFADRAGLISFEGMVRRPELSYNIENVWKRINKNKFSLVHVIDDPTNHRLLVAVPLDAANAISHLLYADYSESFTRFGTLDPTLIKWSIWTFPSVPVCICGDVDSVTKSPVIHIALTAGNIYDLVDGLTADFGNAIDSFFQTSLKSITPGWIHHFGHLKLRVTGTGNLAITLLSEDDVNPISAGTIALATSPGLEPERKINYVNEKMSTKFRVSNLNEKYRITRVDTYVKPMWMSRPG